MSESGKTQTWSQIVTQIKKTFSRMTDKNINALEEKIEKLPAQLESAYGYAKSEALKEFEKFKVALGESSKAGGSSAKPDAKMAGQQKVGPAAAGGKPSQPLNSSSTMHSNKTQKGSHPPPR